MRLIDADKLLTKEHQYYNHLADEWFVPVRDIEDAPTIEERKKGKWFATNTFMPDHYGGYYINQYVCTNCESEFFKASKFCPNCGADMREEKTDVH